MNNNEYADIFINTQEKFSRLMVEDFIMKIMDEVRRKIRLKF